MAPLTNVAVLGFGAMGRIHARVFRELTDAFTLSGVFDTNPAKTRGVDEARRSASEAVSKADLVVLATPMATHAELAASLLQRGHDVFVEKPMCTTSREAEMLLEAANRHGRQLFVGHSERFNPAVRGALAELGSEAILSIECTRIALAREPDTLDDETIFNLGVHDLDLITYLARSPLSVEGIRATREAQLAHIEVATLSGVSGKIVVGRKPTGAERALVVRTETRRFEADLLHFGLTEWRGDVSRDCVLSLEEPLVAQARAVRRALRGDVTTGLASSFDGAGAVRAAERSLAENL
jgi:UDP-N-acetylglucosamine 3-dehydrogenase